MVTEFERVLLLDGKALLTRDPLGLSLTSAIMQALMDRLHRVEPARFPTTEGMELRNAAVSIINSINKALDGHAHYIWLWKRLGGQARLNLFYVTGASVMFIDYILENW